MAEPQLQPPPPQEQQYQAYAQYTYPDPQQPQPYDPNQQQAAVPYDPSYEAHYAAYYQQQQQCYDPNAYSHHHQQQQQQQQYHNYSQVYPHHQPDPTQIHPQQFDPASYHHYLPPYPPEANTSGRGGGPPFRAHGSRGGRHGRGRGRGGGRNPNRFGPTMPPPPKLPVIKIWCDICRVECSRMDILEQHKNGKRHKKTAQKLEEMQKQQKMLAGYQANVMPGTMYPNEYHASAVPSAVHASLYHQPANVMPGTGYQQENPNLRAVPSSSSAPNSIATAEASSAETVDPAKASEAAANIVQVDDASKSHSAQNGQNSEANVATAEGAAGHVNPNQSDARRGGIKRKPTRYGRGGKKQKKFDTRCVPERPRVCTLCNVTCETQTGFDTHIAGKKHNSKLKRLQHHGAVFGPITVYIPPNQPTPYPILGPEALYYGLNSYNMVNQVAFNLENQDAPLVFVPKESNGLDAGVDVNVTNLNGTDLDENNNEGIGNVAEKAAFDSELEVGGNTEMNDALDVTKDSELEDNAVSES